MHIFKNETHTRNRGTVSTYTFLRIKMCECAPVNERANLKNEYAWVIADLFPRTIPTNGNYIDIEKLTQLTPPYLALI